jgi:cell division protein FtsN
VVVTALPEEVPPEEAETVLANTVPEEGVPEAAYPEESVWYTPPEEGSVFTLIPAEERPPAVGDTVPEITALPAEEPPAYFREEPAVPYNAVPGVFSVPSVNELEPGKYYLQLGAYSKTDAVEQEITKIEKNLPLAVQCTGGTDKPVYRILVGPVNHGESGALLQRFRGRGYKDAFVRKGE